MYRPDNQDLIKDLWELHLKVLKYIVSGKSFNLITKKLNIDFQRTNYIENIKKSGNLSLDKNSMILAAYPISPIKTDYLIKTEGIGTGYAMCAIDALGVAYTFNAKTTITAKDQSTNNLITLEIDPSKEVQDIHDLVITYHNPSNNENELSNAIFQCPLIKFYSIRDSVPNDKSLSILEFTQALSYAKFRFSPEEMINRIIQINPASLREKEW